MVMSNLLGSRKIVCCAAILLWGWCICCHAQVKTQAELCMIGDSITWAEYGDCFRKSLLHHIPELAFVGTHSACWGFSHAGEGGNTTHAVLKRIDNKLRVPDAANYHLLIGINDAYATTQESQIASNARGIAQRIFQIVTHLQKRPTTKKIFVGTILPCFIEARGNKTLAKRFELRDRTGQMVNKILRKELTKKFSGGNVILIEYEKPIRAIPDWGHLIYLHPTPIGYDQVAAIAAKSLKDKLHYTKLPSGTHGVEIVNLWNKQLQQSSPLIPGWYTLSFEVTEANSAKLNFELFTVKTAKMRFALHQKFEIRPQIGKRCQINFMTGYEGFTYSEAPVKIKVLNGKISHILLEKMRPHQKASRYGTNKFVDTVTPRAIGEKIIFVHQ